MNQKLFTVEDCFKIVGRGIAVVGEFQPNLLTFKVGGNVVLIRPNGTEITTEVGGLETIQTISGIKKSAILIKGITKEDVPVGTHICLKT